MTVQTFKIHTVCVANDVANATIWYTYILLTWCDHVTYFKPIHATHLKIGNQQYTNYKSSQYFTHKKVIIPKNDPLKVKILNPKGSLYNDNFMTKILTTFVVGV